MESIESGRYWPSGEAWQLSEQTVSVVIPAHERPDHLAEAVESALAQTVKVLEVIVVDDASVADLRSALTRFGDNVRFERLPQNAGANVARNRGIALARGHLIAFLDDDDVWMPEKLALQIPEIDAGAEACLCATRAMDGSSREKRGRRVVDEDWLRASTPCGTSGLLATRDVMQAESFDPAIPRGQDWDVFVRLARRRPIAYIDRPLYLRRSGHDRITTAALRKAPAELLESAAVLYKHRDWLGEGAFRRRLARVLLSFIAQRKRKSRYVATALRHAGPKATFLELLKKLRG